MGTIVGAAVRPGSVDIVTGSAATTVGSKSTTGRDLRTTLALGYVSR